MIDWLLVLLLLAGWFFFLRPQFLGGPATYLVVSGDSMEPVLSDADLVFVLQRDSYLVGEVVAYFVSAGDVGEGRLIIHRIIGGSADEGYVVQGDNRDTPDQWHPFPSDIAGRMLLAAPGGGRVLVWMRTPLVLALIASVLVFLNVFRRGHGEGGQHRDRSSGKRRGSRPTPRHRAR